eukprot:GHVN01086675.1.p1 GENE.GHVN01086675.1~~GHVN01086675.1.p1  ORF type:complete len:173 (-),score=33.24 GHVN01086675.1:764-1282(-)
MEVDATTSPPQCVDASPERTSVRGRNVSSRKWKDSSSTKRTSSHSTTLSRGPRLSWEAKKAARMEKQEMKKIESELLSKTARSKKQRHEAIKENRKRRAENEVKTYGKNAQVCSQLFALTSHTLSSHTLNSLQTHSFHHLCRFAGDQNNNKNQQVEEGSSPTVGEDVARDDQ